MALNCKCILKTKQSNTETTMRIQNGDSDTLWVKQQWLSSQAFWFIFVLSKG